MEVLVFEKVILFSSYFRFCQKSLCSQLILTFFDVHVIKRRQSRCRISFAKWVTLPLLFGTTRRPKCTKFYMIELKNFPELGMKSKLDSLQYFLFFKGFLIGEKISSEFWSKNFAPLVWNNHTTKKLQISHKWGQECFWARYEKQSSFHAVFLIFLRFLLRRRLFLSENFAPLVWSNHWTETFQISHK